MSVACSAAPANPADVEQVRVRGGQRCGVGSGGLERNAVGQAHRTTLPVVVPGTQQTRLKTVRRVDYERVG